MTTSTGFAVADMAARNRGSNLRGMDHWREFHAFLQREAFGPADGHGAAFPRAARDRAGEALRARRPADCDPARGREIGFDMAVAMSAALELDPGLDGTFYPGTYWSNPIQITEIYDHINAAGVMELDRRTSYAHEATTVSEGMVAETVGVGSKYVASHRDATGEFLNFAFDYVQTVPADLPAEQFWSVTGYNAKTRAMVYTDGKDVSSRMDLFVDADESTPVYLSSDCEIMPHPQNCIDTAGEGDVFVYFRAYAPTRAFFDRSWSLPDIRRLG